MASDQQPPQNPFGESGPAPTPPSDNPYAHGPGMPAAAYVPPGQDGDATGGVIPYKNGPALIAYYIGIFAWIPCLAPLLCLPAIILGVLGLQKAKREPHVRGKVHAWVGIIGGGLGLLFCLAVAVLMVIGAVAG